MKANSHTQGCGSFACLLVLLLAWGTKTNKRQKLQDRKLLQQHWFRSSQYVVLFVVILFIFQQAAASDGDKDRSLPATRPASLFLSCHNYPAEQQRREGTGLQVREWKDGCNYVKPAGRVGFYGKEGDAVVVELVTIAAKNGVLFNTGQDPIIVIKLTKTFK